MSELIFEIEHDAEGGFTAQAVGESIFAQASDMDTLRANVRDAINAHFDEGTEPKVIHLRRPAT